MLRLSTLHQPAGGWEKKESARRGARRGFARQSNNREEEKPGEKPVLIRGVGASSNGKKRCLQRGEKILLSFAGIIIGVVAFKNRKRRPP